MIRFPHRRLLAAFAIGALLLSSCSSDTPVSNSSSDEVIASTDVAATTEPPTAQPATAEPAEAESAEASAPSATTASEETTAPEEPTATPAPADDGMTSIVVDSDESQYFVLWVKPELNDDFEIPVAVVRGESGQTTLTDGRPLLPSEHYRVETKSVAAPDDIDGDGIDDLAELTGDVEDNPLNPAGALDFNDGVLFIPDSETFATLSYQGDDVARDEYLAGLEFVKFILTDTDTPTPSIWFMNTETWRAHPRFAEALDIPGVRGRGGNPGTMRGDIVFNPNGVAPDGTLGTYRFAFQPNDAFPFSDIAIAFEHLSNGMPFLTDNLLYEPYPSAALPLYEREKDLYDAYRIPILLEP